MYRKIMVPVDLQHSDQLNKALATATDIAKHYGSEVTLVGVTASAPTAVAESPKEFAEKLADFAAAQSAQRGISFRSRAVTSPDPTIDIDDALNRTVHDLNADLVVMASRVPGYMEYIFASRAGYLASHSDVSVFVVRG